MTRYRYGGYHEGPDPLAAPFDVAFGRLRQARQDIGGQAGQGGFQHQLGHVLRVAFGLLLFVRVGLVVLRRILRRWFIRRAVLLGWFWGRRLLL